jgi:hypothetical protein
MTGTTRAVTCPTRESGLVAEEGLHGACSEHGRLRFESQKLHRVPKVVVPLKYAVSAGSGSKMRLVLFGVLLHVEDGCVAASGPIGSRRHSSTADG